MTLNLMKVTLYDSFLCPCRSCHLRGQVQMGRVLWKMALLQCAMEKNKVSLKRWMLFVKSVCKYRE